MSLFRTQKAQLEIQKTQKEKEELNERCISMEGLVKMEHKGGVVKELEMRVAQLTCKLSEALQDKVTPSL